MEVPKKINIGSGKDYRTDYLNIDISNDWNPDIVLDMSSSFLEGGPHFETERFGTVQLDEARFDEIMANDVLEHVPDLVACMTNCLKLLREGGVFSIIVPYDLSYGAWQDPTHVRAFNERSWLYYTDWFWYLNWHTHRFKMAKLDFSLSPMGKQLLDTGQHKDQILITPRAVDAMQVRLEKIALSADDKLTLERYQRTRKTA